METLLIGIVCLLLFINQIKLRKKNDSLGLALRGIKGYCDDFTKSHEETANQFFLKCKSDYLLVNEKLNKLYSQSLKIEDKLNSTAASKTVDVVKNDVLNLLEKIKTAIDNCDGVAEYNVELANKISEIEKKLPKKKVTRKK